MTGTKMQLSDIRYCAQFHNCSFARDTGKCALEIGLITKCEGKLKKYGLIEVETYDFARPANVYLDGVDVTLFCTAANDIEGWIDILKNDGKQTISSDGERKRGNVLIVIDE